ncbi:MAG: ABC transporter ATP-binding protein [Armatimonadetes bacterium]|nr:ABC transporter ATP-binding protein [Armatimonadota bacterium]HOM81042.1 ABC transporter ATP-binding protein [Armatimonadota bacterium]HPO73481.1 ABC transporter ATP-binding protein [Armatimonadota bacterium]
MRGRRRLLAGALLTTLVISAGQLAGPKLKQIGIDDGIRAGDARLLGWVVVVALGVHLATVVAGYFQASLLNRIGQDAIHDLRLRLFDHLQAQSLDYYEREQPGQIISRILNDMDAINELLTSTVTALLADVVVLVGTSVILFRYHTGLALAIHFLIPLMFLLGWAFRTRVHATFMRARQTIAAVTARLHESVAGMRVIQGFAREHRSCEEFGQLLQEDRDANMAGATVFATLSPGVELINALGICIVFWYGGLLILRGELAIGVAVAFILYLNHLFDPVRRLSEMFATVQRAVIALERVFEVLDRKPTVTNAPGAVSIPPLRDGVEFRGVCFSYDGAREILRDVSFRAGFGETVALVGPTGAGKSTILKLLARFYDPQAGEILLDGRDLRSVTLESLRRQIGFVPQEPFLFAGSLRDNIRYGRPDAPDAEVERAARLAQAHDFIAALPEGYDTDVHERGVRLSGGQRQLIAFARALLVNPRILILDEATSSVDPFTEKRIQDALRVLLRDRIAFVIAHRLSTVVHADQILVVQDGGIAARGRHEELLYSCSLYRALYERRFQDTAEEEAVVA